MPDSEVPQGDITVLLHRWRDGDEGARDQLMELAYEQLHSLARRFLGGERKGHTIQPTELVNEAFLRLARSNPSLNDRIHFFAVAANVTRRVLVDHARAKRRERRGGGWAPVSFEESMAVTEESFSRMVEIDAALDKLAAIDERKARIVELIFFGGMTKEEAAMAMGLSPSTLFRDLKFAKAWLAKELEVQRPNEDAP
ncbi:MAG: sigma-70 family RNA polymerase sigma factor [Bryobacterales bacterium]|nr:sigma-70 family RNA polymerase sigma factor [Bryobacterales bacterium]